jgi:hypothetical protein
MVVVGLEFTVKLLVLVPGLGVPAGILVLEELVGKIVIDRHSLVKKVGLTLADVEGSECVENEALEERSVVLEVEAIVVTVHLGLAVTHRIDIEDCERVPVLTVGS